MAAGPKQTSISDTILAELEVLLEEMRAATPPKPEQYTSFIDRMEDYVVALRRAEQGVASAGGALDPVTGFRTTGIEEDLKREQDRFDRKGAAFSVACIELDHQKEQGSDAAYAHLAKMIGKTVRSFDDAFYLGHGSFVVILKHLKFSEACAAMERLRRMIEDSKDSKITISCGVAEAVKMEASGFALEHAREALATARKEGGNRTREYHEISKLARYIQEKNKDR
jgi:diguanylate cyclase (GGDEF)-like protein